MGEVKNKFMKFKVWLTREVWLGRNPDKTLAKRFKLFVVISIALIASSKLLYFAGLTVPNLEIITPTLVVVGAFSLYTGRDEKWDSISKYFGVLALISVFLLDVFVWGFRKIYMFTWPAFIICWVVGLRKDLSFFDKFSDLALEATITTTVAIILFDVFTASGFWLMYRSLTLGSLYGVFMAQIPFTLYHLTSLIFVPPLVGMGKAMSRVRVRVPAASRDSVRLKERR